MIGNGVMPLVNTGGILKPLIQLYFLKNERINFLILSLQNLTKLNSMLIRITNPCVCYYKLFRFKSIKL